MIMSHITKEEALIIFSNVVLGLKKVDAYKEALIKIYWSHLKKNLYESELISINNLNNWEL